MLSQLLNKRWNYYKQQKMGLKMEMERKTRMNKIME